MLWLGGERTEHVAKKLGIVSSTVTPIIREVSRVICSTFSDAVVPPRTEQEIRKVMKGFEDIAGMPYCTGAIDGSHIHWRKCPGEQKIEYRCYKGFPSVVLFGVSDAERRFLYVDVYLPGVL